MAERDDPRFPRPPSDRPEGDASDSNPSAGPDPLAELARIVSGSPEEPAPQRPTFSDSGTARGEGDLARDLEAELLENLQASFDALRSPLEPDAEEQAEAAPAEEPAEAAPAEPELPAPDEGWDQPAGEGGYDSPPVDEAAAYRPPDEPDVIEDDPFAGIDPASDPDPYADQPIEQPWPAEATADDWPPETGGYEDDYAPQGEAAGPVEAEDDYRAVAAEPIDPQFGEADAPAEESEQPFEEDDPFLAAPGAAAGTLGRWADEEPAEAYGDDPYGDDPFAPQGVEPAVPLERPVDADWDDEPVESAFDYGRRPVAAAGYDEPAEPERDVEPELDFDSEEEELLAAVDDDELEPDDGYDEDHDYRAPIVGPAVNFDDDDMASIAAAGEPPRRSRRGALIAGSVIAIVLVGAVTAVAFFRSGDEVDTLPPVIAASNDPFKIDPPDTAETGGDAQAGKLSYDRIIADDQANAPQLSASNDAPILDIPPPPEPDAGSQQISRIILPDPTQPDADTPVEAIEPPAPPGGEDELAIQPKRVRTVVVKPDGTIISNDSDPVADDAAMAPPEPPQIPEAPVVTDTDPAPELPEPPAAASIPEPVETPPVVTTPPEEPTVTASPPSPPTVVPPVPAARPSPPSGNTTVAIRQPDPGQPISLTPNISNPPPPPVQTAATPPPSVAVPTPTPGGSFVVQVSAQRSQEAALSTFSSLQQRFPTFLGNFQANIQRADLGERGIYFRVRVGPMASRDEAVSFCERFKAAGGDCIVARN